MTVSQSDAPFAWRVELPPRVLSAGSANLTITVDEPRSPLAVGWSTDERPLGLHLRSLTLGEVDHSVQPRQPVVFGEGTDGERLLAEGWSLPDATGVWTDGDRARLVLELTAEPLSEAVLVLDVVPFLTPEHAELTVDVWALDTHSRVASFAMTTSKVGSSYVCLRRFETREVAPSSTSTSMNPQALSIWV